MRYFSLLRLPSEDSLAFLNSSLTDWSSDLNASRSCSTGLSSRDCSMVSSFSKADLKSRSDNNYVSPRKEYSHCRVISYYMSSDDELEAIKQRKMAELQKAAAAKAMMSALTEPVVL